MGRQHQLQNTDTSLVLSSDPKPRLKWTRELHQRFVDAITHLGGPDKATPKGLMRVMSIPGLTLYHLKSHLQQKYRLGKSQHSETCHTSQQEDYRVNQKRDAPLGGEVGDGTQIQINESLQIAQALQMQMEVQRKLHEQIEVQRRLQLRIEAQGKYLHAVLKKAQETLAGYSSSSVGVELAKAELSRLVSMVDNGCPSSSFSVLTDIGGSGSKDVEKNPMGGTGCSLDSSLTSCESSGRVEEKQPKESKNSSSMVPSLMDQHPRPKEKGISSNQLSGRKRSGSSTSLGNFDEQLPGKSSPLQKKRSSDQLRKLNMSERFDLNSQYLADLDSGPKSIDLN
ncbi:hypothetical protein NMG60_11009226 [Bertholletia excelsa]